MTEPDCTCCDPPQMGTLISYRDAADVVYVGNGVAWARRAREPCYRQPLQMRTASFIAAGGDRVWAITGDYYFERAVLQLPHVYYPGVVNRTMAGFDLDGNRVATVDWGAVDTAFDQGSRDFSGVFSGVGLPDGGYASSATRWVRDVDDGGIPTGHYTAISASTRIDRNGAEVWRKSTLFFEAYAELRGRGSLTMIGGFSGNGFGGYGGSGRTVVSADDGSPVCSIITRGDDGTVGWTRSNLKWCGGDTWVGLGESFFGGGTKFHKFELTDWWLFSSFSLYGAYFYGSSQGKVWIDGTAVDVSYTLTNGVNSCASQFPEWQGTPLPWAPVNDNYNVISDAWIYQFMVRTGCSAVHYSGGTWTTYSAGDYRYVLQTLPFYGQGYKRTAPGITAFVFDGARTVNTQPTGLLTSSQGDFADWTENEGARVGFYRVLKSVATWTWPYPRIPGDAPLANLHQIGRWDAVASDLYVQDGTTGELIAVDMSGAAGVIRFVGESPGVAVDLRVMGDRIVGTGTRKKQTAFRVKLNRPDSAVAMSGSFSLQFRGEKTRKIYYYWQPGTENGDFAIFQSAGPVSLPPYGAGNRESQNVVVAAELQRTREFSTGCGTVGGAEPGSCWRPDALGVGVPGYEIGWLVATAIRASEGIGASDLMTVDHAPDDPDAGTSVEVEFGQNGIDEVDVWTWDQNGAIIQRRSLCRELGIGLNGVYSPEVGAISGLVSVDCPTQSGQTQGVLFPNYALTSSYPGPVMAGGVVASRSSPGDGFAYDLATRPWGGLKNLDGQDGAEDCLRW